MITLKAESLRAGEESEFSDSFAVFPVFSVFKRYHTRYHSNIASCLYLVDLHVLTLIFNEKVDRMIQLVTALITELHRIEDSILLNGVSHRLSIQRKPTVRIDFVNSAKTMIERLQTDV